MLLLGFRYIGAAVALDPRFQGIKVWCSLGEDCPVIVSGRAVAGDNMIRSELVSAIADANPHLTVRDVETLIATIFDEIAAALAVGRRVELRGFGAFSTRDRDARTGRNPRTGEAVKVDAKRVPFFKPGKELRERLNAG